MCLFEEWDAFNAMSDRWILVFYLKKKKHLRAEEIEREDIGDRWSFVNVLPRSGFIHTVHHGKRTEKEADQFIKKIKEASDGRAPLFLSDGWKYEGVLKNNYCHYEALPYSGIGRPRNPLQVVDPQLKYAQIIKHKKGNKLVEIEKRVVLGNEVDILSIIRGEGRGKSINTSYVESRNGNYR